MDAFVDFGWDISEKYVVPVHKMLHYQINEAERCDQWTNHAKAKSHRKNGQNPSVMYSVVKFECRLLSILKII